MQSKQKCQYRLFNPFFALMLLALCSSLMAAEEKSSEDPGPKIVLLPATMDLGKVPQQTKKTFDLAIANEGTKDLTIKNVSASCGCTAVVLSDKTIKPGAKGKVQVTFNAGNFKGTIEKSVLISSNDTRDPVKEFTFTAFVVPAN